MKKKEKIELAERNKYIPTEEIKQERKGMLNELMGIEISLRRGDGDLVSVQPSLGKIQQLIQRLKG